MRIAAPVVAAVFMIVVTQTVWVTVVLNFHTHRHHDPETVTAISESLRARSTPAAEPYAYEYVPAHVPSPTPSPTTKIAAAAPPLAPAVGAIARAGAAVAAADEFRANLVPMIEATRWITDGGAPPAHWVVHGESDLDYLEQPAISRTVKEVFEARFRNTSVIVKWVKDGLHLERNEAFTEIVFLEYCRGGPGIPRLLGAYRNENGTVVWVVEKVGESIGNYLDSTRTKILNFTSSNHSLSTNPKWRAFVEAAPLDAARAIFRCFRSFSEIGGFYLDDFHPGQFTFFEGALYVIDGLRIAGGPARDFVDKAFNVASFLGNLPLKPPGFLPSICSDYELRQPNSKYMIIHKKSRSVETKNMSQRERCGWEATKVHVKHVATKPFLLPFVIDRSAGDDLKKLEALSATMQWQTRPSFTELLAALS